MPIDYDNISKVLRDFDPDADWKKFQQEDPRTKAIEKIDIDIRNLEIQKRELESRIKDDFERIFYGRRGVQTLSRRFQRGEKA
jgi:hypothetical protein